MFNNKYAIIFLFVALYLGYYQYRYEAFPEIITLFINKEYNGTLFKQEELNKYDGVVQNSLYLSILGSVFDVTKGREHYAPGSSYNAFIGKDASRLFVTGEFSSESDNVDDVNDLPCNDLFSLQGWVEMYHKRYLYKGRLVGRFYDNQGKETQYYMNILNKIESCKEEQLHENDLKKMMPPCNVEWMAEVGTRVWCSSKSGGIQRSWVGVPRQLFTPGKQDPTCVCINTDANTNAATLKEYSNCDHKSVSCDVEGSQQ